MTESVYDIFKAAAEFNEIKRKHLIKLSLFYASEYERNPKNFINCFKKFKSIRSACDQIINVYKRIGAFEDCKKMGDFSEWANKQETEGKEILAEILLIIYSIVK